MYTPAAVITADYTYILIKHIESLKVVTADDELSTIDKLKSDLRMEICTVSGKTYVISMRHQMKELDKQDDIKSEYEYRDCIVKRWIDLGNTP